MVFKRRKVLELLQLQLHQHHLAVVGRVMRAHRDPSATLRQDLRFLILLTLRILRQIVLSLEESSIATILSTKEDAHLRKKLEKNANLCMTRPPCVTLAGSALD